MLPSLALAFLVFVLRQKWSSSIDYQYINNLVSKVFLLSEVYIFDIRLDFRRSLGSASLPENLTTA